MTEAQENGATRPLPYSMTILNAQQVPQAIALVRQHWGHEFAAHFGDEMARLLETPYVQLIGAHCGGNLVGIAELAKSQIDFAYWCLTWVVVSPNFRSMGIGRSLVEHAEALALNGSRRYPGNRVLMLLTTSIPVFYEKLGYRSIFDGMMVKELLLPGKSDAR